MKKRNNYILIIYIISIINKKPNILKKNFKFKSLYSTLKNMIFRAKNNIISIKE